jgi:hypothetical protein
MRLPDQIRGSNRKTGRVDLSSACFRPMKKNTISEVNLAIFKNACREISNGNLSHAVLTHLSHFVLFRVPLSNQSANIMSTMKPNSR